MEENTKKEKTRTQTLNLISEELRMKQKTDQADVGKKERIFSLFLFLGLEKERIRIQQREGKLNHMLEMKKIWFENLLLVRWLYIVKAYCISRPSVLSSRYVWKLSFAKSRLREIISLIKRNL